MSEEKKKKTYFNATLSEAEDNVRDLKIVGDGDTFRVLCKVSSQDEGWMKSTKAMEISGIGCVVKVSTQQGENIVESLCFVPDCRIVSDINGGMKLVK